MTNENRLLTEYRMPAVEIGTLVHWHPDGNAGSLPLPAIVTRVSPRSVDLNVVDACSYNFLLRSGVRHALDPELRRAEVREDGAWTHTPQTLRLEKILADLMKEKKSA